MGEDNAVAKPRSTFYRKNSEGLIECIDCYTGAIIAIQESIYAPPQAQFVEVEIDGQKVLVQSGISHARLPKGKLFQYSEALKDVIAQLIADGTPYSKIPNTPGMPDLLTLKRWQRKHEDFAEAIALARRARAERLRDEAVSSAESADGTAGEFVAGTKLKVDTLKWAAEKDDPETYGAQTKVNLAGSVGVVQLVVETGIRRAGDKPKDITPEPDAPGEVVPEAHAEGGTRDVDTDDGSRKSNRQDTPPSASTLSEPQPLATHDEDFGE